MLLAELRKNVLDTAFQMVVDGLAHGAQGNISALDRETGLIAITPSALPYKGMQVEDICIIDRFGNIIEGKWRSTSETPMHTIFYRERPDVGSVIHTHSPFATVFGIIYKPIPMVLIEAASCLTGPVPVAVYMTPGTEELARLVVDTMAGNVAVVLAQHGLLTVGADLGQAYDTTMAAETSARLVIMARSLVGEVVHELDPEVCKKMRADFLSNYRPHPI
jgi:L-ribulose-5-phosphate 4-epimerase